MDTLTPEIITALSAPFPIDAVAVKAGEVRSDGLLALALPYADWRVYADRLDSVVGTANWSIQLIPWESTRIIARLTIFGITKDASGEGEPHDKNCGTSAEAQAKKRACAEFGMGRYLYSLPQVWGKGQSERNNFRFDEPQALVVQIYQQAGLLPTEETAPQATVAATLRPALNLPAPIAPHPERLARARDVLAQAEQRTKRTATTVSGPLASERQRGAICALIARCAEVGINPNQVDRLGIAQDIPRLSGIRRASHLPGSLTKTGASILISELDTLVKAALAM